MGNGDEDRDLAWHGDLYALAREERKRALRAIGAPGLVTARALIDALPIAASWQSEIATLMQSAGTPDGAQVALSRWAATRASDTEFAAAVYRSSLQSDLGGQLFVRTIEAPEAGATVALAADGSAGDGEPFTVAFLELPFAEAIDAFMRRRLMTPEEFRSLSDAARTRAFAATGLATSNLAARAQELLRTALASGSTLDEFVRALRADEVSLGVTASSSGYLETVFRTNVQASYGAGRYRQLTSPEVRAARPYIEYRTVRDDRVRPRHAALDGAVFSQDDPDWPRFAPPNGFNCRCVAVARRARDIDAGRVVSAASINDRPDPGFDAPPE